MGGLFLVQWIHVLAAAFWFGSVMAIYFVTLPALLKTPAAQSHAAFRLLAGRMTIFGQLSGQLTFWLGILRGTMFGPIKSFADLVGTPYGHTFMTALVLTVIAIVNGAISGRRVEQRVWDGDMYRADAVGFVRSSGIIKLIIFTLIVASMVMMRFGA
jgi:putative copper export protein